MCHALIRLVYPLPPTHPSHTLTHTLSHTQAAALTTNPLLETADVTAFIEEMARALEASPSSSCPYYHQSTTEDEKRRPLLQHRH